MLHWTASGAVPSPVTVQIRVTRRYPGRVAAGAPAPTRELGDDEIRDNLRFFTRSTPRTRPCTALVLSGVSPASRPGLAAVLADARAWGVSRVTLHRSRGDDLTGVGELVDAVAVTVGTEDDLAAVRGLLGDVHGPEDVVAVVELVADVLPRLDALVGALAEARPSRVVLTWPFPSDGTPEPPPVADVAAAIPAALARLDAAGVTSGVKGLPACALGDRSDRLWRTANRWYVDADHQKERALLFFPDVVRFTHVDECRFCALADRCDGPADAWLRRGLTGRLRAFAQAGGGPADDGRGGAAGGR